MPTYKERMLAVLNDFTKTNRGIEPQRFVLSEDDMLTLTEGDLASGLELKLFGIPVIAGKYTHIE